MVAFDSCAFCGTMSCGKPKSDRHLISPYNAESSIRLIRIKKVITNLRDFDY